jgi:hypothetical protein
MQIFISYVHFNPTVLIWQGGATISARASKRANKFSRPTWTNFTYVSKSNFMRHLSYTARHALDQGTICNPREASRSGANSSERPRRDASRAELNSNESAGDAQTSRNALGRRSCCRGSHGGRASSTWPARLSSPSTASSVLQEFHEQPRDSPRYLECQRNVFNLYNTTGVMPTLPDLSHEVVIKEGPVAGGENDSLVC